MHQGACNRNPLGHSSRQVTRPGGFKTLQSNQVDQFLGALAGLICWSTLQF